MRLHHERRGADAVAEETHAFHQRAVGHAGCGKHDVRPRGELLRAIDSRDVCDPHRMTALLMLRAVHDEPRVDLATETAHRGSGKHAFRRTTSAHYRVHAAADDGGGDAGGQITIADQPDTCARRTNLVDQLGMAWPVQHDDNKILD